jgi:hypothetical protein
MRAARSYMLDHVGARRITGKVCETQSIFRRGYYSF